MERIYGVFNGSSQMILHNKQELHVIELGKEHVMKALRNVKTEESTIKEYRCYLRYIRDKKQT